VKWDNTPDAPFDDLPVSWLEWHAPERHEIHDIIGYDE
jgi:hypothetical protein